MPDIAIHDALFINGEWVKSTSGSATELISPFTEQAFARVPRGTIADVDRAVGAARDAFDAGGWSSATVGERLEVLGRLSELLDKNRDHIAHLVTQEMGCPISLSQGMQATNPRLVLDTYLRLAQDYPWTEVRRAPTGSALVRRAPVGVVAAIVPWNAPLYVTMLKVAPALLTGCTMVLKPAPETPLDAFLLAEYLAEAGLPKGVLNVVTADREVSESLVTHAGVDKVSFTGSTDAGRRIASLCGQDLRRVTLELGGKSAAIVLDDADLDLTVRAIQGSAFRNAGQSCAAKTRVLVHRDREAELLDRLAVAAETMTVGDPFNASTEIGPLVSQRQRTRVEELIASGSHQGAKLIAGGGRPQELSQGWFVEPTVFGSVDPRSRIAQEEIFGPVVSVIPYEDEQQAIAIANDSQYGLSGAVFTADVEHGVAVAGRIRTGTVEVNASPAGFDAPMGGFKASGIGREFGPEGIDAYTELQSIGIPDAIAASMAS